MAVLNITKKSDNFCVKNDFVDRFMCDANGSFVKVYLYCLRLVYAESPMSISKIASVLNMIQSDVISALKYWDSVGVLRFSKNEKNDYDIELFDTFEDKSAEKYENNHIKADSGKAQINVAAYSRSDLMTAMQGNEKIKQLFTLSSQLLNKTLNTNDMNIIYMFYDYLKFPPEVIFSLLEYCVSSGKSNMRYIEKVALSWADNEINTAAKASAFIRQRNKESLFEKKYKTMFKISGRDFTESELKLLKTWINDLKASDEEIMKAYETTVVNTGKVAFKYMDSVLRNIRAAAQGQPSVAAKTSGGKNSFRDYNNDEYDIEAEIMRRQS